jgi:hypothetical protein
MEVDKVLILRALLVHPILVMVVMAPLHFLQTQWLGQMADPVLLF